jgi:hypothetical protein
MSNFMTFAQPVMPHVLGSEIFVTVDKESLSPLVVTMMEGAAFPIEDFAQYVDEVNELLQKTSQFGDRGTSIERLQLNDTAYCRVLVIGDEITFLAFCESQYPTGFAKAIELHSKVDSHQVIDLFEQEKLIAVDGWMKTTPVQSDFKLWATRE